MTQQLLTTAQYRTSQSYPHWTLPTFEQSLELASILKGKLASSGAEKIDLSDENTDLMKAIGAWDVAAYWTLDQDKNSSKPYVMNYGNKRDASFGYVTPGIMFQFVLPVKYTQQFFPDVQRGQEIDTGLEYIAPYYANPCEVNHIVSNEEHISYHRKGGNQDWLDKFLNNKKKWKYSLQTTGKLYFLSEGHMGSMWKIPECVAHWKENGKSKSQKFVRVLSYQAQFLNGRMTREGEEVVFLIEPVKAHVLSDGSLGVAEPFGTTILDFGSRYKKIQNTWFMSYRAPLVRESLLPTDEYVKLHGNSSADLSDIAKSLPKKVATYDELKTQRVKRELQGYLAQQRG